MHSHCLWHCQKCESNFKNSKNKETDSFSAAILLGSALYTEGYEAFKIHGSSKQEHFQIPSFRRPPKSLRVGQFLETNSSRCETLKQTFLLLSCSPNAGAGGPTKKGDGESSEYVYVYPTPSPSPPPPEHAKLNLKPTANSALGTVRQFWAWKNWQSSVVERQDSRQKNNDGRMNAEPGTVARLLFKYICTAPPAAKYSLDKCTNIFPGTVANDIWHGCTIYTDDHHLFQHLGLWIIHNSNNFEAHKLLINLIEELRCRSEKLSEGLPELN